MASQQVVPAPRFSALTAALLSFVFPGLGQSYLRQPKAALVFAAPAIFLVMLVVAYLADGLTVAALRMLDPVVAIVATVVIVQFGLWRAFSVLHAWRTGSRASLGFVLVPVLVAAIALSHGVGAWYTFSFMLAGDRMFTEDVALDTDLWPEDTAFPPPTRPGEQTFEPNPTGAPVPSGGVPLETANPDEPPDIQVPDQEEPSIEPGPAPGLDPGDLEGADDAWTNVLVVGIDWATGRTHALTDSMIVVSIHELDGAVYMFSFPRDVAEFPLYDGGTYTGRLNSFANYAHGHPDRYPGGGMRALSRQIGFLLGAPIDYFASVNIPGFKTVLDSVGPITVYNAREISDPKRNFYLSVGEHRLDTDSAMHFVRSRYGPGNNDFVRAARQQEVLAALRQEILRPDRVGDLPRIVDGISRVLSTDYPPSQINEALRLAELVGRRPKDSWVFGNPAWAIHPPMSETGGRWVIRLRMDKLADLSRELFGSASLYGR